MPKILNLYWYVLKEVMMIKKMKKKNTEIICAYRTDIIPVQCEELVYPGCHTRRAVSTMKSDRRIHHCFTSGIHLVFSISLFSLRASHSHSLSRSYAQSFHITVRVCVHAHTLSLENNERGKCFLSDMTLFL